MSDKPESDYKDDPKHFAASSDRAQGGATGEYAGGGVDDSSANYPPAKGEQTWQQGKTDAPASGQTAKHDDEKVESRSADPGQSSYGGFKNEGPSEQNSDQK